MSAAIAEAGEVGRGIGAQAVLTKASAAALHLVGFAPVYFAAKINVAAAASQGPEWSQFAVVSTIGTAILVELAVMLFLRRMIFAGFVALALVTPFFTMNMLAASGNVASADTHSREAREAHQETSARLTDRRRDAVGRRNEYKEAAAGETKESALGKIEKLKAERPNAWNYSHECDPKEINLASTKQFCADIASFKAKAAAAVAYEKAVAEIANIDAQTPQAGTIVMQSTGQGAAVAIAAVATRLGHPMSQDEAEKVFEYGRGGGLELLAAIGPCLMSLFAWLLLGTRDAQAAEAEARRAAAKERRRIEADEAEERRREAQARRAAEAEARAAAEAEEKARTERAAKRAEAKTRETGDPETVKTWLNSKRTVFSPGHVLPLPAAYVDYAADCKTHGETPVARGRHFADELRKLGLDVRERGNRKRFEVYGLALSSHTGAERLRIVASR